MPKRTLLFLALGPLALSGCEDSQKVAAQAAADEVALLVPIVKEDAAQVRNGLPAGAKKLGTLLDPEPGHNLPGLQRAIAGARSSVKELDVAKSTFFSFADPSGTVLRSESDPDMLLGKSVFAAFPPLAKAVQPTSGIVEAYGSMNELRGVKTGVDTAWIVAHPVIAPDGQVKGVFVTGWSFRRFAFHLHTMAQSHVSDRAKREGNKKVPIVYVFAVKGEKAYGPPVIPDVDVQAIEGLKLLEKTAKGPFQGTLEVTGRMFGVAAQRTPELGDDAAVAVMISPT